MFQDEAYSPGDPANVSFGISASNSLSRLVFAGFGEGREDRFCGCRTVVASIGLRSLGRPST
jgi:hypothetical protein